MTGLAPESAVEILPSTNFGRREIRVVRVETIIEEHRREIIGDRRGLIGPHVKDWHSGLDADADRAGVEQISGNIIALELTADAIERHGRKITPKSPNGVATETAVPGDERTRCPAGGVRCGRRAAQHV